MNDPFPNCVLAFPERFPRNCVDYFLKAGKSSASKRSRYSVARKLIVRMPSRNKILGSQLTKIPCPNQMQQNRYLVAICWIKDSSRRSGRCQIVNPRCAPAAGSLKLMLFKGCGRRGILVLPQQELKRSECWNQWYLRWSLAIPDTLWNLIAMKYLSLAANYTSICWRWNVRTRSFYTHSMRQKKVDTTLHSSYK